MGHTNSHGMPVPPQAVCRRLTSSGPHCRAVAITDPELGKALKIQMIVILEELSRRSKAARTWTRHCPAASALAPVPSSLGGQQITQMQSVNTDQRESRKHDREGITALTQFLAHQRPQENKIRQCRCKGAKAMRQQVPGNLCSCSIWENSSFWTLYHGECYPGSQGNMNVDARSRLATNMHMWAGLPAASSDVSSPLRELLLSRWSTFLQYDNRPDEYCRSGKDLIIATELL